MNIEDLTSDSAAKLVGRVVEQGIFGVKEQQVTSGGQARRECGRVEASGEGQLSGEGTPGRAY